MARARHNYPISEAEIDAGALALLRFSRGNDKEVGAALLRGARASAEVVLIAAYKVNNPDEGLLPL